MKYLFECIAKFIIVTADVTMLLLISPFSVIVAIGYVTLDLNFVWRSVY